MALVVVTRKKPIDCFASLRVDLYKPRASFPKWKYNFPTKFVSEKNNKGPLDPNDSDVVLVVRHAQIWFIPWKMVRNQISQRFWGWAEIPKHTEKRKKKHTQKTATKKWRHLIYMIANWLAGILRVGCCVLASLRYRWQKSRQQKRSTL